MADTEVQLTITVDADALEGIAELLKQHDATSATDLVSGPLQEHGDIFAGLMMKFYMREGSSRVPMDPEGELGQSIGYRLVSGKGKIPKIEVGILNGPDYAEEYLAGTSGGSKLLNKDALFRWLKEKKKLDAEKSRRKNPRFKKARSQKKKFTKAGKRRKGQRKQLGKAEAKRRHFGAIYATMSKDGIASHDFVSKAFASSNWQATLDHMGATLAKILEKQLHTAMLAASTLKRRGIAPTEFARAGRTFRGARSIRTGRFTGTRRLFRRR